MEGEIEFICDVKTDTDRSEKSDNSDICFDPVTYCPATIDQFAAQTYTVNTDSAITLTQTDYSVSNKDCPFTSWAFTVTQFG